MGESLLLILSITLIDLVLSGDNAVVIAMACRKLPERQKRKAIWIGALGAVGLRIILTFAAVLLLKIPYIQTVGAVMLLIIAVKLLSDNKEESEVKEAGSLAGAVGVILAADFIMSLDNVLAVAAVAKGNIIIIAIGIMISIPMVVWGSTLIMKLLSKFPVLIYVGAAILGFTAGGMLTGDERVLGMLKLPDLALEWGIPIAAAVIVLAVGWMRRHKAQRVQRA